MDVCGRNIFNSIDAVLFRTRSAKAGNFISGFGRGRAACSFCDTSKVWVFKESPGLAGRIAAIMTGPAECIAEPAVRMRVRRHIKGPEVTPGGFRNAGAAPCADKDKASKK